MTQRFKAAILDMDGTIIDGRDPKTGKNFDIHTRSWEEAASRSGIEFDEGFHKREARGKPLAKIDELYRDRYGLQADVSFSEVKQTIYREEMVPKFQYWLDGAEAALDKLVGAEVPIGLVTNAPSREQKIIAENLWFERYFDRYRTITVDDMQDLGFRGKPDPGGLLTMVSRLGFEPSEVIFAGDTETDMATGAAAGIYTIGVKSSDSEADLISWGANETVDELGQVLPLLGC